MTPIVTHLKTYNWEGAIRGMRNPKKSWHLSDSSFDGDLLLGPNDLTLAKKLTVLGGAHRKFLRQIQISMDVTANLKFFDQFATYEHTVSNSTSQMHTLMKRPFKMEDFSGKLTTPIAKNNMKETIQILNELRDVYLSKKCNAYNKEDVWRDMIEIIPQSILYTRTITMNYEVFLAIYHWRSTHKMDEWVEMCDILKNKLPYMYQLIGAIEESVKDCKDITTTIDTTPKLVTPLEHGDIWDLSGLELSTSEFPLC